MPGSKSDYLEAAILNWLRGTAMPAAPATVYLGAFTAAPNDAGGGTEVAGGSYARKAVALTAPAGGQISNSAQVVFDDATADWGTITAIGLFDASAGGNLLGWATLGTSKIINSGARLVVDAGAFTFAED